MTLPSHGSHCVPSVFVFVALSRPAAMSRWQGHLGEPRGGSWHVCEYVSYDVSAHSCAKYILHCHTLNILERLWSRFSTKLLERDKRQSACDRPLCATHIPINIASTRNLSCCKVQYLCSNADAALRSPPSGWGRTRPPLVGGTPHHAAAF